MFLAVLTAVSGLPITVDSGFTGTATLNSDFTRTDAQIIIAPGARFGSTTVTAVQDPNDEPNETILVDILSVVGCIESGIQQSLSLIAADDLAWVIT